MRLANWIVVKAAAEKRDGDGVVQNRRSINDLMNGAPQGHAESSFAGAAGLHEMEFI